MAPLVDARPGAPYHLTDEAAEVWEATVQRMPANWFPAETWPTLAAYCSHAVTFRKLAAEVGRFEREPGWMRDDEGCKRFDLLTRMREREGRAMIACARSLRIAKSSQMRAETAGRAARDAGTGGRRLWEFEG